MRDALRGRRIVVTRPAGQAAALTAAITAAGGEALAFPLLEIEPLAADSVVAAARPYLDTSALAVFVSPNAVRFGLIPLQAAGLWPPGRAAAAVGQGTARALEAAGLSRVVVPSVGFDSEALLDLEEFRPDRVGGRDVLLFKGEGGRPLLADTLAARGARVRPVACYRRLPPRGSPAELLDRTQVGVIDAVVITSSEALGHFDALFDADQLARVRNWLVVATHPRIGDAARRLGYTRVAVCDPGDAAVAALLTSYNWPSNAMPNK